jgi:hypothetical protein
VPLGPLAAHATAKPLRHLRSVHACGVPADFRPPPSGAPLPLGGRGACEDGGARARGAEGAAAAPDTAPAAAAEAWWRWARRGGRAAGGAPGSAPGSENPEDRGLIGAELGPAALADDPLAARLAAAEGAAAVLAGGAFAKLVELAPPGFEPGFEIPITIAPAPAPAPAPGSAAQPPAAPRAPGPDRRPRPSAAPHPQQHPAEGGGAGEAGAARAVAFLEKPLLARVTTRREQHERVFKAALLAAGLGAGPPCGPSDAAEGSAPWEQQPPAGEGPEQACADARQAGREPSAGKAGGSAGGMGGGGGPRGGQGNACEAGPCGRASPGSEAGLSEELEAALGASDADEEALGLCQSLQPGARPGQGSPGATQPGAERRSAADGHLGPGPAAAAGARGGLAPGGAARGSGGGAAAQLGPDATGAARAACAGGPGGGEAVQLAAAAGGRQPGCEGRGAYVQCAPCARCCPQGPWGLSLGMPVNMILC